MSDLSSDDLRQILGDKQTLSVDGNLAGHGISYVADGNASVNGEGTASVSYKLNEEDLKRTEKRLGLPSKPASSASARPEGIIASSNSKHSDVDDRYACSFDKFARKSSGLHRPYRMEMASTAAPFPSGDSFTMTKGPLQGHIRQLKKVRESFKKIAERKDQTRAVNLNSQNLPQPVLKKMADKAIQTGSQMTPAGPVQKMAGMSGLAKAYMRWEGALFEPVVGLFRPKPKAY